MGQARANSRPLARYLALINVAAVIAALGVITNSSILIVGAMAVSPDLLPICATAVGLVGGRYGLARRAFVTLVLGLGLVVVTAMVLSALLKWTGLLPDGFKVEQSSLATLAHTDYSTVLIALAAGVAAMLSFETRASTAVGVAISVTTIPASAYLGVALGGGGIEHALGARGGAGDQRLAADRLRDAHAGGAAMASESLRGSGLGAGSDQGAGTGRRSS